jgi:hypothetical protein
VRAVEARRGARRWIHGALAAALVCCAAPAAASAAPTLAITTAPDPVESLATQVGMTGTLETDHQAVVLTVKPAGGPACGANPSADDGTQLITTVPGIGPYAKTVNWTFDIAGSYLLCAWATDTSRSPAVVLAATSQTLAVRIPHLSLSLAAPATILRGRTFQIATTAQTEAARTVYSALLRDTGRGCPANWSAAYGTSGVVQLVGTTITGGPATRTVNAHLDETGRWLVCGYVNYGSVITPEATASATIDVVPPCIVPRLGPRATLRRAKARIVAGHCTVGAVGYAYSRRRPRGRILRLSPRPGSGHATNAAVAITVSNGPPPPPRRHGHRRG